MRPLIISEKMFGCPVTSQVGERDYSRQSGYPIIYRERKAIPTVSTVAATDAEGDGRGEAKDWIWKK